MSPVIPDRDVWWRACTRLDPDPLVVAQFTRLAQARCILLVGEIRRDLLARLADERQAARMAMILAGFPEPVVQPDDHLAAAARVRRLRLAGRHLPSAAALIWTLADRFSARIWSSDTRWRQLGAPVV
jgi:predicted nucleic acid-binding protein